MDELLLVEVRTILSNFGECLNLYNLPTSKVKSAMPDRPDRQPSARMEKNWLVAV